MKYVALGLLVLLAVALPASLYLVRQSQDNRPKAFEQPVSSAAPSKANKPSYCNHSEKSLSLILGDAAKNCK